MDIKATGFKELAERFRALAGPEKTKALKKSLRPVGALTKKAIEDRTPVRVEQPTTTALPIGALKADVHFGVKVDEVTGVGSVVTGPGKKTRHVANWVEYGHVLKRGKKAVGHVPAHPYIRPAAEATAQQSVDTFSEAMTAEVIAQFEGK